MAFPVPPSLSPSSLATFTGCGLAYRFSAVERLPEPATLAATRGTLVHAALEHLFGLEARDRTVDAAPACVDAAIERLRPTADWTGLELDELAEARLRREAIALVEHEFVLEDPTTVQPVGLEMKLQATIGGVTVRGIIDRLDLVDGQLVVTDYKTGRAPSDQWARRKLTGVQLYAILCEQNLGRRPAAVQLLHLAEPVAIVADTSDQSTTGLERRIAAVWSAVEQACEREDFRPKQSSRCSWCAFQQWCPLYGGDPAQAAVDLSPAGGAVDAGAEQASLLPV